MVNWCLHFSRNICLKYVQNSISQNLLVNRQSLMFSLSNSLTRDRHIRHSTTEAATHISGARFHNQNHGTRSNRDVLCNWICRWRYQGLFISSIRNIAVPVLWRWVFNEMIIQSAFTCSKLTMETPEQCVESVQN